MSLLKEYEEGSRESSLDPIKRAILRREYSRRLEVKALCSIADSLRKIANPIHMIEANSLTDEEIEDLKEAKPGIGGIIMVKEPTNET